MSLRLEGGSGLAGPSPVMRVADLFGLAATPAFSLMAFLTAFADPGDILCGGATAAPWTGMVAMYVLMCVAHCRPG
jgi:hypothetical protein